MENIINAINQLKKAVEDQTKAAERQLNELPDSQTKKNFTDLLSKARSGKISVEKAKEEVQKILKDAN